MSSSLADLRAKRAELAQRRAAAAGGAAASEGSSDPQRQTPPAAAASSSAQGPAHQDTAYRSLTVNGDGYNGRRRNSDSSGSEPASKKARSGDGHAADFSPRNAIDLRSPPPFGPGAASSSGGATGGGAAKLDAASLLSSLSARERSVQSTRSLINTLLTTATLRERQAARPFQQLDANGQALGVHSLCRTKFAQACEHARRVAQHQAAVQLGLNPHDTRHPRYPALVLCDAIHVTQVIKLGLTNRALGDCSYLNHCSNRNCRLVHYEIDPRDKHCVAERERQVSMLEAQAPSSTAAVASSTALVPSSGVVAPATPSPAEWLNTDIRFLDVSVLGEFDVIMMDPPWRINMSLPYGTMSDEEMLGLNIAPLQKNGICLVWVVTRALDAGRRCLARWGYTEAGELLWVKIDQLHRLKRTGRTGHWLNHSKEHCLIGIKGAPLPNRLIDCDVIVSQTRETSRKPDEVYGMLDRLVPNARRLEIFGRHHNTRPGWLTLGNQLGGHVVHDADMRRRIEDKYGDKALQSTWLGPGESPP